MLLGNKDERDEPLRCFESRIRCDSRTVTATNERFLTIERSQKANGSTGSAVAELHVRNYAFKELEGVKSSSFHENSTLC